MKIKVSPQKEKAPSLPASIEGVKRPTYGRSLEHFREGDVYVHPRGMTVTAGLAALFATSFHEANPLYLNKEYAKALGHPSCPASPQLVFNIVLSLGVQNDSEKAMANLGYYDAMFLRPVYAGDTIRSLTKVLARKDRGEGKPGIVTIRTLGLNQRDEPVLQYDRKIMVAPDGSAPAHAPDLTVTTRPTVAMGFPEVAAGSIEIPEPQKAPRNLTGARTWFDDFKKGDVIVHANGRTITDEHVAWTYRVGNTHPLHYDRLYSNSLKGSMSGEPIVYGGLVFAWLEGLASRDTTENALCTLGFTEGYHTQPAFAGDTVYAISRVLDVSPIGSSASASSAKADLKAMSAEAVAEGPVDAGVVTFQLIGVKNIRGNEALEKFGAALFTKENEKKDAGGHGGATPTSPKGGKIPEKIFEIERRILIRTRG